MQAEVEAEIVGARATHNVDVAVTFTAYGIDHTWLVECKLWRRKVHKAEVLTLRGVIEDAGADRGFLLSESGFDPGAVTAARLTNITLTNLEDLRANAKADIEDIRWEQLYSRITSCKAIAGDDVRPMIRNEHREGWSSATFATRPGFDQDEYYFCMANLGLIEHGLERVRRRQFPIAYRYHREEKADNAHDVAAFFDGASKTLDECERWLRNEAAKPWPKKPKPLR